LTGPRRLGVLRHLESEAPELRPLTLRFDDPSLERAFQYAYIRDNLTYIRLAHVIGIASWSVFGLLAAIVLGRGQTADLVLRFGVAVPMVAISLWCTYARWYLRYWQTALALSLLANGLIWATHRAVVGEARPDWGYAGLMLILAFTYVLSRMQFLTASIVGALMIGYYEFVTIVLTHDELLFANFFLLSFAAIGTAAAYGLDRAVRLLYLRERQLDRERERADDLLRNTLPRAIVDRLKGRAASPSSAFLADGLEEVSVLFADLVGFTVHAERMTPDDLVTLLDDVFSSFDAIAGRLGIEKIKTVGDAYMAAAGAPQPRPDHAAAAAEMALEIVSSLEDDRWPSGEPLQVRIGIASGPAVAGVIGRRTFAYDLWGDTVNLASRLEANGRPGRILVSDATAALLEDRFVLSEPCVVELKGKGPTPARFLEGRRAAADAPRSASSPAATPPTGHAG
jgi:adenylate cyclase